MTLRLPPTAPRAPLALALALGLLAAGAALAQDDDVPAPSLVPNGNDCASVIARWQGFAGQESQGGHMDTSVYNQVQNDIDRADHLCQAGQDAQARQLVEASKRKHGY